MNDNYEIKIDTDIPIPKLSRQKKYPFEQLEIGQSFFVPGGNLLAISQSRRLAEFRTGWKFATRTVEGGIRVWRIPGKGTLDDVQIDPEPMSAPRTMRYIGESLAAKFAKFKALDWTKSNVDLSRETGYSLGVLSNWRRRLNMPLVNMFTKKVSEEQLSSADWENRRDIDLAREWGVSRERVRQLRAERNSPETVFQNKTHDYIADMK